MVNVLCCDHACRSLACGSSTVGGQAVKRWSDMTYRYSILKGRALVRTNDLRATSAKQILSNHPHPDHYVPNVLFLIALMETMEAHEG